MADVLLRDDRIALPDFTVITASAGSGKTHTLTLRFLQLLLSETIPHNTLKGILAITYTNNAASEMRSRVISYLKSIALGNPERIKEVSKLVSLDPDTLHAKANALLDTIFERYSDLQVRTIDSFTAGIFKSTSVEFGYAPDFEILLQNAPLIDYAFDRFLKELSSDERSARQLEELAASIDEHRGSDASFLWNPYAQISREIKELYNKIAALTKQPIESDQSGKFQQARDVITKEIEAIEGEIDKSGFQRAANYVKYAAEVRAGDIEALLGKAPLSKPIVAGGLKKGERVKFDETLASLQMHCDTINTALKEYAEALSASHYRPFLGAFSMLQNALEDAKRETGQIIIGDINKKLYEYLEESVIPGIYLRLGERIYHFLIDEFQDTTPIQWANMNTLIENALAQGGTLLVVGDTKQAIYGFTGADWRIMAEMREHNVFPMAHYHPVELTTNYRSYEKILEFTKEVFQNIIPTTEYGAAADQSGLTKFTQEVKREYRNKGLVEVHRIDAAQSNDDTEPEKTKLLEIIRELLQRGYGCGDIAVLARKNSTVVAISGWLNEAGIPSLSQSSLDIRCRKIVGEMVALLRFLDSPVDDLSFATFILGEVFARFTAETTPAIRRDSFRQFFADVGIGKNRRTASPLYGIFRDRFPDLWENNFETLFNLVGYLPLYDLLTALYKTFRVFELHPEEEASLVKLLEVIKNFEAGGNNSLKDFLELAGDEEDAGWQIEIPPNTDAVRLMTTHKAKGLQFPVVISLLYNSRNNFDYLHKGVYVAEEGGGVALLKISKEFAGRSPELAEVYEETRTRDAVNELNLLYVAFTRAQKELYVIGVDRFKQNPPLKFLPQTGYEYQKNKPKGEPEISPKDLGIKPLHHTRGAAQRATPTGVLGFHETRRGDCLHNILAQIHYIDEATEGKLHEIIASAVSEYHLSDSSAEIESALRVLLTDDNVREYFTAQKDRTIFTEQEFVDRRGRLFRTDRILIDADSVTIIDFKTGKESDSYRQQILNYVKIAAEIFPKRKVRGVVIYIDAKKIVKIV
jgi:ATP-dependent exoDNAse (exonuclease V) beta subunit